MSEFNFVTIEINLWSEEGDTHNVYTVYKQTVPSSVLGKNNPQWLEHIISIVNKLEVPHV